MRRPLFGSNLRASVARRRASRPRLERVERRVLLSTFTVWNTGDDGEGSLRWAIVQANHDDGPTRIEFDIAGDGERTIRLNAALDPLVRPVAIDGRSQPGYAGRPLIRLDGSGLAAGENGLVVAGGDSLVAGLVITGFPGAGIVLTGGGGNLVESSYVGVDPSGVRAASNGQGVLIVGSSRNTIGGAGAGNLVSGNAGAGVKISAGVGGAVGNLIVGNWIGTDGAGSTAIGNQAGGVVIAGGRDGLIAGNVISGNRGAGVSLVEAATNNVVVGNAIGLTADGRRALGNLGDGVLVDGASANRIGGLAKEESNQISGNRGSGVRTRNDSAGLVVQGNQIGTDATGELALGNLGDGLTLATSHNMIGGESTGAGNIIAHNGVGSVGAGVRLIDQVNKNAILSNAIHGNAGLGIDLGNGPTSNRPPGGGPGPNNWQTYPILSSALYDGVSARAAGTLAAAPLQTYLVQLFWSDRPDPSGFGEGQRLLGSLRVVTDSKGEASFTIAAPSTATGGYLTATATDAEGNTSEFARSLLALPSTDLSVSMTATPSPAEPGGAITFTVIATNRGQLDADHVVLIAQFPSTATVVSAASTRGGTRIGEGATVSARVGSLGPGESTTFTIVVQPQAGFTGDFAGSVRATMDRTDDRPDDNEARATVRIVSRDTPPPIDPPALSLTLDPPSVIYERSTFQYALVVANPSSRAASAVTLAAPLPSGLAFVRASTSWGGAAVLDSGRVIASLDSLPAGATATLTILVRPTASAGAGADLRLSGDLACPDLDPAAGGGSATHTARVLPAIDLMVRLEPKQTSSRLGDGVYWVANVWNSGPSPASGVVLRLPTLGAGGVLASTATQGTIQTTADGMTVFFGTIAPGSYATVAALLNPRSPGAVSLVATVAADQHDLTPADNLSRASLSVLDWPGLIQFGTSAPAVPETVGVAIIPVERSVGSLGTVSIRHQTAGGSAIAGVDYQPVSGVLTFEPGETVKYVSVPILANPHGRGDVVVGLVLDAPTGGAVLGERSVIQLTIRDLNPDHVPPQAAGLHLLGGPNSITGLSIGFSEQLDPGSALNGSAYRLVDLGPSGIPGSPDNRPVGLHPPSYDPATQTVTLAPLQPLAAGRNYAIVLVGAGPGALADPAGNPLAGNSDGVAGVDYISLFARGPALGYTDSKGNLVTLRATGGGFLDLTRTPAGDARVLTLQGGIPGRTTLSGSVVRQRGRGDGVAVIDSIEGLGQFGQIRVALKSPPFLVNRLPFNLTVGRPLPVPTPLPPPRPPAPIRPASRPIPPAARPLLVRQAIPAPRVYGLGMRRA